MTVIKSDDTEVKRGAVVLLSCVAESFLDAGGGEGIYFSERLL